MRTSWIAVLLLWFAAGGHASMDAPFAFPRSTPEAQGVSSAALLRFVDEAEQKVDAMHSFMLVRHGQVVAEGWWAPYAADEPHMLFSLSKSFTSTAVGLADRGGQAERRRSGAQVLPRRRAGRSRATTCKAMRVRDLLRMSTGHHDEDARDFPTPRAKPG